MHAEGFDLCQKYKLFKLLEMCYLECFESLLT